MISNVTRIIQRKIERSEGTLFPLAALRFCKYLFNHLSYDFLLDRWGELVTYWNCNVTLNIETFENIETLHIFIRIIFICQCSVHSADSVLRKSLLVILRKLLFDLRIFYFILFYIFYFILFYFIYFTLFYFILYILLYFILFYIFYFILFYIFYFILFYFILYILFYCIL